MSIRQIFSVLAVFELLSFLAWLEPHYALLIVIFLSLLALWFSFRSPMYGLELMLLDLLVDPMGRMIAYDVVSFRMMLFGVIMIAWLIRYRGRLRVLWDTHTYTLSLFLIFFAVLVVAVVRGLSAGFDVGIVIDEVNGYVFWLLIFPVLSVRSDQFYSFVVAGLAWLCMKSAFLFVWFSHVSRPYFDSGMYHFFRDTRVAELTPLAQQGIRVFLQSHIFAAIGVLVLVVDRARIRQYISNRQYMMLLVCCVSLLLMSLSRSMWLATGLVSIGFILFELYHRRFEPLLLMLKSCVLAFGFLALLFFMPAGEMGSTHGFVHMFAGRGEIVSEHAAVSRWVMLPQLHTFIVQQPLLGYGFGFSAEIVGVDNEIAVRHVFEWGWHDMVLTFGAVGVLFFLYIMFVLFKKAPLLVRLSVLSLLLIHVFTPYLNHPLGIGILLVLIYMGNVGHGRIPYPRK